MRIQTYLLVLLVTAITSISHAAVIITTSTPTATDQFVRAGTPSDFFGIVSGGQIDGSTFDSGTLTPPDGSVAGRDQDGNGGLATRVAQWSLSLPGDAQPSTGITAIDFTGVLAASQDFWDHSQDFVTLELLLNGVSVSSLEYQPTAVGFNADLALDTAPVDGLGDGTIVSTTGIATNLTAPGDNTINSVILRLTASANAGGEEYWASGTLTGMYTQVPEPSSFLFLGLVGLAGSGLSWWRRRV